MASVVVENVFVHFPIHNIQTQSLRGKIVNLGSGGILKREAARLVVVTALQDVSFRLQDGDRVGLIGRNGAGKTTLLKLLAGIYEPAAGTVTISGSVSTLFDIGIGMDEEATGYENIIMSGVLRGKTRRELYDLFPSIEEFTELGEYLSLPLRTYSAGMRMRLGFAVATAIEPEMLLIDEAFETGDEQFRDKAQKRMEELLAQSRILVFASHSRELIRRLCNKVMLLQQGGIVAFGDVDDVLEQYHVAAP